MPDRQRLNVAVNLYGEDFLVALTRPDAARHDLAVINRLLCDLHQWYRAHLPVAQLQAVVAAGRCQPPGHGQLCGCTTHLLSAEVYREFIAPLDDALLSVYPHGGMIHLCGVHTQHLPVWREMASLRAVQLNDRAAEDLEAYFRGLREDQVIYLNPTPTMTVARALAIRWPSPALVGGPGENGMRMMMMMKACLALLLAMGSASASPLWSVLTDNAIGEEFVLRTGSPTRPPPFTNPLATGRRHRRLRCLERLDQHRRHQRYRPDAPF